MQLKQAKLTSVDSHPLLPNRPRPAGGVARRTNSATTTGTVGLGTEEAKAGVNSAAAGTSSDPLSDPLSNDPLSDPLGARGGGRGGGDFVDPLSAAANNMTIIDPLANPPSSSSGGGVSTVSSFGSASLHDPLSGGGGGGSGGAVESRYQAAETARQTALDVHADSLSTPWEKKKQQILKDYVVSGNITLNSSAIVEFAGSGVEDGSDTRHLDKYTQRLASLERRHIKEETVELTQKEYQVGERHTIALNAIRTVNKVYPYPYISGSASPYLKPFCHWALLAKCLIACLPDYVVLLYFVLCVVLCVVLFCVVLCFVVCCIMCCVMFCCVLLYYVLCYVLLCVIVLCVVLCFVVCYCIMCYVVLCAVLCWIGCSLFARRTSPSCPATWTAPGPTTSAWAV